MLLLFDIDGTLITGGPARRAFQLALERTYGTTGSLRSHSFAGKTDGRSLREILSAAGCSPGEIKAREPAFWDCYLGELESRIGGEPVTRLPGAHELVCRLSDCPDAYLGLVTGNVAGGARLKLQSAGLWEHFAVGAFGCDHEVRNELPRFALDRASAWWGRPFRGEHAVVIGDTPLDVECGQAVGATTVAVATGQYSLSQLGRTGADHVLPDLADTAAFIEILDMVRVSTGTRGVRA